MTHSVLTKLVSAASMIDSHTTRALSIDRLSACSLLATSPDRIPLPAHQRPKPKGQGNYWIDNDAIFLFISSSCKACGYKGKGLFLSIELLALAVTLCGLHDYAGTCTKRTRSGVTSHGKSYHLRKSRLSPN